MPYENALFNVAQLYRDTEAIKNARSRNKMAELTLRDYDEDKRLDRQRARLDIEGKQTANVMARRTAAAQPSVLDAEAAERRRKADMDNALLRQANQLNDQRAEQAEMARMVAKWKHYEAGLKWLSSKTGFVRDQVSYDAWRKQAISNGWAEEQELPGEYNEETKKLLDTLRNEAGVSKTGKLMERVFENGSRAIYIQNADGSLTNLRVVAAGYSVPERVSKAIQGYAAREFGGQLNPFTGRKDASGQSPTAAKRGDKEALQRAVVLKAEELYAQNIAIDPNYTSARAYQEAKEFVRADYEAQRMKAGYNGYQAGERPLNPDSDESGAPTSRLRYERNPETGIYEVVQ